MWWAGAASLVKHLFAGTLRIYVLGLELDLFKTDV